MKTLLLIALTLGFSFTLQAQQADKALIRINYTFKHIQDTNARDKVYTENMLLMAGKNAAVYTSADKVEQAKNRLKQIQEQIKNNAGGAQQIRIDNRGLRPLTQADLYSFAREKKLFTKETLFNSYLVDEALPVQDWTISADTMSFSGLACQKATTRYKGRNWIAWFAADLPFQSGPWKLNGLPGLIIEAYDDKKEVQFLFAGTEKVVVEAAENAQMAAPGGMTIRMPGLDNNTFTTGEIKLPENAIKTTRKELDKLKEARDKDPMGFMQAQMGGSGMNGSIRIERAPGTPAGAGAPGAPAKPVVNNPIERTGN